MSTPIADPLAAALFSKAQAGILGLLYARPDESFYLRQLAALTGLGLGQAQRELAALENAGILRRTLVGRHVFFQANADCPIFSELRSIVTKTVAATAVVRAALLPLAARIAMAFIFGSVARNEERKASDLDLLVVGSVSLQDVVTALKPAERHLGREINPVVYPPREFTDKLARRHHFLTNVVQGDKLFVIGGAHELAGLSPERLD
jgi:predicted nucleotidyltransferase